MNPQPQPGLMRAATSDVSLPLDGITATPEAAYSMRKLRADYTGQCLRLERASDNEQSDFGFVSTADAKGNYWVDTAAIATWIGASSAILINWYDQSGNGNDITVDATDEPDYTASGTPESQPTLSCAATGTKHMKVPSLNATAGGITVLAACKKRAGTNGYIMDASGTPRTLLNTGTAGVWFDGGWKPNGSQPDDASTNFHVYSFRGDSSSWPTRRVNGVISGDDTNDPGGIAWTDAPLGGTIRIGAFNTGSPGSDMDFAEWMAFSSAISYSDLNTLEKDMLLAHVYSFSAWTEVPIYFLNGQSNAEGVAPNATAHTDYRTGALTGKKIWDPVGADWEDLEIGVNNLGNNDANGNEHGPEMRIMYDLPSSPTPYMVKHAVNSASLANNFKRFSAFGGEASSDTGKDRLRAALNNLIPTGVWPSKFRVIYNQGEQDMITTAHANAYEASQQKWVDTWEVLLGHPDVAFVISRQRDDLPSPYDTGADATTVRNAQNTTATNNSNVSIVDMAGQSYLVDDIHLDETGVSVWGASVEDLL